MRSILSFLVTMTVFSGLWAGASIAQDSCLKVREKCLAKDAMHVMLSGPEIADFPKIAAYSELASITLNPKGLSGAFYDGPAIDLGLLNDLPHLSFLRINDIEVQDWSALKSASLTRLDASGAIKVSTLDPDLRAQLQLLWLKTTDPAPFEGVQYLPNLESLNIDGAFRVADLPKQTRQRLETLTIGSANADVLDGAASLNNLNSLRLRNVTIENLNGLGRLRRLEQLSIERTTLQSLDGLQAGKSLKKVYAEGSALRDISALANAPNLEHLEAKDTNIADISALAAAKKLQVLFLTNTQVSDLSPLSNKHDLKMLSLSNTQVTDLSPLAGLTDLVGLWLNKTDATDFTPLLEIGPQLLARIGSSRIVTGQDLPDFIAREGWKTDSASGD